MEQTVYELRNCWWGETYWVLDWYVLLLSIHAHECTATVCLSALICFIEMCMGAVTTILALWLPRAHSNCWGRVLLCILCKQS